MNFEKLEKILLIICIISILAFVGYYVKDGFKTYTSSVEYEDNETMITAKISGEVENPGSYRIAENSRVCDLIYFAGGITHSADLDKVDLDAVITDSMEVNVPADTDSAFVGSPVVNINKATSEELMLVPGIGEELAKRIIEYRKENGNFSDISEIVRVKGLGDKSFEKIKEYIKTED